MGINRKVMKPESNLSLELIGALKRNFFQPVLIDYGLPQVVRVRRGTLLVLALELSKELRDHTTDKRVGVVLPPGLGGVLANVALFIAGKIPVNLNFTLGSESLRYALEKAEIKTIISAEVLKAKLPSFPWLDDFFDISKWVQAKRKRKGDLIWRHIFTLFSPLSWLLPKSAKACKFEKEAALLFTSGSSGNPKGVPLSHGNLLSNCQQIDSLGLFEPQTKILANLPLFHSFGFTVSTLYPLLSELQMVCVPSPLDVKLSLQAIENERIKVLLGTPTFLRGYLRKAERYQVKSIDYVIAGAEKTPHGFKEKWEFKCDCHYLEGYGLTEASPAISFNLPNQKKLQNSVGRLLPGIKGRVVCPDSSTELPVGQTGLLCFQGPNIFVGYLGEPEVNKKIFDQDGWFQTGDLGRIDQDGYLYIEGRLSRFSKIGGEMVPHGKIEEEITKLFMPEEVEEPVCVVTGVSDSVKGEKLLLFSVIEIDIHQLRKKMLAGGMPNLWIPKEIKLVKEIPMLASGKVDVQALRSLG